MGINVSNKVNFTDLFESVEQLTGAVKIFELFLSTASAIITKGVKLHKCFALFNISFPCYPWFNQLKKSLSYLEVGCWFS